MTMPRPPKRLVPPSTTAVIASRFSVCPTFGSPTPDTFIVDSVGFDDRTWLDKFGYPYTDQMRLQERYRRIDADTIELTMTLTDAEYYTRPWESDRKVFKLNAFQFDKPWDEQIYCVPSEEFKFNRLIRDPAGENVK